MRVVLVAGKHALPCKLMIPPSLVSRRACRRQAPSRPESGAPFSQQHSHSRVEVRIVGEARRYSPSLCRGPKVGMLWQPGRQVSSDRHWTLKQMGSMASQHCEVEIAYTATFGGARKLRSHGERSPRPKMSVASTATLTSTTTDRPPGSSYA